MKKSLIAVAVLGLFAGTAHAQSTVTLYGIIDGGVETLSNQATSTPGQLGTRTWVPGAGGSAPDLWGVKGTEDLGGGYKAMFTIEGSMNTGTGSGSIGVNSNGNLFGRETWVGIGGPFGTVKLGLQIDPAVIGYLLTDPAGFSESFSGLPLWINGAAGGGSASSTVNIFDQNAISYSAGGGGFAGTVLYSIGGMAGNSSGNSLVSAEAHYGNGPFLVSGGVYSDKASTGATSQREWSIGASWNFASAGIPITPKINYVQFRDEGLNTWGDLTNWGVGVDWQVNAPLVVNFSYYDSHNTPAVGSGGGLQMWELGATYHLSKRTALYVTGVSALQSSAGYVPLDIIDVNSGTAAAGKTVTGLVLGVKHDF